MALLFSRKGQIAWRGPRLAQINRRNDLFWSVCTKNATFRRESWPREYVAGVKRATIFDLRRSVYGGQASDPLLRRPERCAPIRTGCRLGDVARRRRRVG